ncbi:hypothetical protein E0H51_05665 [Rhizobium leguminosarum bv. viciae]|nr:hypothetical protein CHY08_02775 [Rhizobium leguminosarum bv. viciae]TBY79157.1 hypothetical protein E0H51_05665 [Rhizobium leguminosarum bv. viciae]
MLAGGLWAARFCFLPRARNGTRWRGLAAWYPLCPAGHLPHKGGDRQAARPSGPCFALPVATMTVWGSHCAQPISPPVGEMPGRAEGGVTPIASRKRERLRLRRQPSPHIPATAFPPSPASTHRNG